MQVVFLNHAIGVTPEESLLLQMQGMIAEYERAKIMERNRRGKLHGAKRGSINVLSTAPYGYRYIRKQLDGAPAQYVIDLPQAATVRAIFQWIGMERLSIGEVVRRLAATGTVTASGKPCWDRSVVWGILQNPAYMGRAAFGKTQARDCLPRIRPQRHSADVPKKGYSTVRTDPSQWIEIPVPAIVSEGLFQSVQEQLAENRRATRQRRHGAVYLLQGLTVCGHCHYAYYGKKVSKAAAKGQRRDYAYYRCIGTDAYRFGGERICDNQQIRTDRLDELVWQQVVELLAHPGRLKSEYERRLGVLEEKEKTNPDTAALERQRLQLEKGKSRLIDSYAEGMIDKTDFDPKMRHLKSRLEQLDQQIQESRRHQVGQRELFLVINRLEEFAAAVHDRLDTVDFVTKREIIRGLVKRVEIYKDEILVVFRVDPDPGFNASESSTGSDVREKSMQDRTRRTIAVAGEYLSSLRAGSVGETVAPAPRPWRCDCRALRGRQCGGFRTKSQAQQFLEQLRERLARFGLSLNASKTRLIEFGRFAARNRRKRGLGKPKTFDFLDFTHCCSTNRNGGFQTLRLTVNKRMRATLLAIRDKLKRRRHEPIRVQGHWLTRVVSGYFNYHAVPGNLIRLGGFCLAVCRLWRQASQATQPA